MPKSKRRREEEPSPKELGEEDPFVGLSLPPVGRSLLHVQDAAGKQVDGNDSEERSDGDTSNDNDDHSALVPSSVDPHDDDWKEAGAANLRGGLSLVDSAHNIDDDVAVSGDGAVDSVMQLPMESTCSPRPQAEEGEDVPNDETSIPPWMHRANTTIISASTPRTSSLGIDPRLLATLKRLGVRKCFPVQASVIPLVLAAHAARCAGDVCVCAPTGSGKTLAYALPVVHSLLSRVVMRLRALVLLPTRGLAVQVHRVFSDLCEGTSLRVGLAAAQEEMVLG